MPDSKAQPPSWVFCVCVFCLINNSGAAFWAVFYAYHLGGRLSLSNDEVTKIADELASRLTKSHRPEWLDSETYQRHHKWVSVQIEREAQCAEVRTKIIQSSLAWAVPITLAFICASVWQQIKASLIVGG